MKYPIEIVAVATNRHMTAATLTADKVLTITAQCKGIGDGITTPITFHIFGSNGETASMVLDDCEFTKEAYAECAQPA